MEMKIRAFYLFTLLIQKERPKGFTVNQQLLKISFQENSKKSIILSLQQEFFQKFHSH
jgi:hypothetical protein